MKRQLYLIMELQEEIRRNNHQAVQMNARA